MTRFNPQGLLLLALLMVISESKGVSPLTETISIVATREEDVVLPCFEVMDPKNYSRVKLIKYASDGSQMKVILARPETPKFQDAERVKCESDGNGQISISLTKAQKSDEGLYGCEICQGWDCILVKNISLKVKDCKALSVKAEPSTPVNLNCPVDKVTGQQGPQNFSWAMLRGGNPVPVHSKWAGINGSSLAIQSVSFSDRGWYRCTYMLGQTQRCFDIHLQIQEVENVVVTAVFPVLTTSESIWETRQKDSGGAPTGAPRGAPTGAPRGAFIAAVMASVFIGIALMAALIGLFIYRRRNTRRVIHQTLSHTAGTDLYEIVNLTEDRTNQRVNSIYQQQDDSLCTFHY